MKWGGALRWLAFESGGGDCIATLPTNLGKTKLGFGSANTICQVGIRPLLLLLSEKKDTVYLLIFYFWISYINERPS